MNTTQNEERSEKKEEKKINVLDSISLYNPCQSHDSSLSHSQRRHRSICIDWELKTSAVRIRNSLFSWLLRIYSSNALFTILKIIINAIFLSRDTDNSERVFILCCSRLGTLWGWRDISRRHQLLNFKRLAMVAVIAIRCGIVTKLVELPRQHSVVRIRQMTTTFHHKYEIHRVHKSISISHDVRHPARSFDLFVHTKLLCLLISSSLCRRGWIVWNCNFASFFMCFLLESTEKKQEQRDTESCSQLNSWLHGDAKYLHDFRFRWRLGARVCNLPKGIFSDFYIFAVCVLFLPSTKLLMLLGAIFYEPKKTLSKQVLMFDVVVQCFILFCTFILVYDVLHYPMVHYNSDLIPSASLLRCMQACTVQNFILFLFFSLLFYLPDPPILSTISYGSLLLFFLILCCCCIFSKSSSSRAQLISRATPTATCFTEESLLFFFMFFFAIPSPPHSLFLSLCHPHLHTNSLLMRFSWRKKRRNIKCMLCSLRTSTAKLIRLC